MAKKPLIGVTGPVQGGGVAWFFARLAVWLAGGRALRITPLRPVDAEELDGLIVGGGADVDPTLYGEVRQESLVPEMPKEQKSVKSVIIFLFSLIFYPILYLIRKVLSRKQAVGLDKERDVLERRLIDCAVQKGKPVLGICRGAQLLNVYFGGSLYQDLKEFYIEIPQVQTILPKKRIRIAGDSKLAGILKTTSCKVNALHKQAIKKNGEGVRVAAREQSGVVQAIEHGKLPFVIGVQWHPEFLPHIRRQRSLFQTLVAAARREFEANDFKHRNASLK